MHAVVISFVGLVTLFTQAASVTPLRTGDAARKLTDQDVAAIKLVLPSDATPWLLNGDPGMLAYDQRIEACLPPSVSTPSMRRGSIIVVARRISSNLEPPMDWTAQPAQSYAQVAIAGRKFDDIQGDEDINRPFRLIGNLEDNDVMQIVAAIRSGQATVGREIKSIRPLPILSVFRQDVGAVRVLTRGAAGSGQSITFHYEGQRWNVVEVAYWAA